MSDAVVLTSAMAVLSLVKCWAVDRACRRLLALSGRAKMGHVEGIKYRMAAWKALYYTAASAYGACILSGEEWLFDPVQYRVTCTALPTRFRAYYLVSLAYYINEFITIFIEPRKKDFVEMLAHHVATIMLIALSYARGLTRYGLAILAIHDLADPWLETAKTNLALGNGRAANVCFFVFMVVFIVSRIGVYPYFIVRPATQHLLGPGLHLWNVTIVLMLNVLVATHVIWSYFIVRVFVRIMQGGTARDTRSEEEEA